jgi:hypothetical protein
VAVPSETEVLVAELETRLDRLRALYEQYFLGFEKLEPLVPRKDIERRFDVLRRAQFRNTALRFRFQQSQQRYNTYTSYWGRILRQIENGTYIRHLKRAQAKAGAAQLETTKPDAEIELDIDVALEDMPSDDDFALLEPKTTKRANVPSGEVDDPFDSSVMKAVLPAPLAPAISAKKASPVLRRIEPSAAVRPVIAKVAPKPTAPEAAAAPIVPPAPTAQPAQPAIAEARIREVYTKLVQEKRARNESTADVTYDKIAKSMRESAAVLKEKHKGKSIDFEVSQRDGKTVLKPVLK